MSGLEFNRKSTTLLLRWLTVLLTLLLMLYSRRGLAFGTGPYFLGVIFFASNLALYLVPRVHFERRMFSSVILIGDAGLVALAIHLTSAVHTDFYLVYFFITLVAATRQTLAASVVTSAAAISLYGLFVSQSSATFHVLSSPFLVRAVFLLLIATSSGYIAQSDARTPRDRKLAAIGQLTASVGHELRNPLGILQNSLYVLEDTLKETDGKISTCLSTMRRELTRANKIIADLLSFSARRKTDLLPTDLNGLLEEIVSAVDVSENVRMVKHLGELPPIAADSEQLRSVFLNLIVNALQAMADGGDLVLRSNSHDGLVVVEVSDTGTGMSQETLEKIFEPLFTTKSQGIGLGLSVTREFVRNHNGTIHVESRPGRGSRFVVSLPIGRNG